jgi:CheY-like chemotaxis protein
MVNINLYGLLRVRAARNMDEKVMSGPDRATALMRALPYARRYARALLGSQEQGDKVVATALRAAMAGMAQGMGDAGARAALYRAIGDEVRRAPPDADAAGDDMPLIQRMLLLLTALEEQPLAAAAAACGLKVEVAERELRAARDGLRANAAARVLIIEDEPIIALDIQDLVERCGHSVVGIAASETEAVRIARAERPSLVLADINLGAGGDGATAVARILRDVTAPVIFVTAFPERLLTGDAVEPAFVITKPFDPTTLAVATYQAVTRGVRPV